MAGPDPDKQTYTYQEILPFFKKMQKMEKELANTKELLKMSEDQVRSQWITIEALEKELRTYQ